MQENIYAAPEAALTEPEDNSVQPVFYVVSPAKFITLYIVTFSLYGLYWHYKNWQQYKIYYNDNTPMPIMRAIFSIFFTHGLFSVVDMQIKSQQKDFAWKPNVWATVAVIALLASRIINQVTSSGSMSEPIEFLPIPLMVLYGVVLLKAQRAINLGCNDPSGRSNSKFTFANCVWIFFGVAIIALALLGIFLPNNEVSE